MRLLFMVIPLPFIDLENLKKAKKASGRLQDLADIENLRQGEGI